MTSGFSEGLAAVELDEKMGYIDIKGKLVIDPQFDRALPFSNERAEVEVNGTRFTINRQGKILLDPTCTETK